MISRRVAVIGSAMVALLASVPMGMRDVQAANGPQLLLNGGCPGGRMDVSGYFFTPGASYAVTSTYGTVVESPVTAEANGDIDTAISIPIDAPPDLQFQVVVHPDGSPDETVTSKTFSVFNGGLHIPGLGGEYHRPGSSIHVYGGCFRPGETVHLTSPQVELDPSSVNTDANGRFDISAKVLAVRASGDAVVTGTGDTSGRTGSSRFQDGNSVLDAGTSLTFNWLGELVSPSEKYRLFVYGNHVELCSFPSHNPTTSICDFDWASPEHDGPRDDYSEALTVRPDDNLVYTRADGAITVWSTGTQGTGSHNQLVVQDNGNLVLYTALHDPVWSWRTGLIRGPLGFTSYFTSIASARHSRTVTVAGYLRQRNRTAALIPGAGRTVYVQRYHNGTWQSMLSGRADSRGHVSISFIQTHVSQYRLVVGRSATAAPASSGSTFR